jgi:hypothetical protein
MGSDEHGSGDEGQAMAGTAEEMSEMPGVASPKERASCRHRGGDQGTILVRDVRWHIRPGCAGHGNPGEDVRQSVTVLRTLQAQVPLRLRHSEIRSDQVMSGMA